MSKNGSIRSFFKPVSQTSGSSQPSEPASSLPLPPSPPHAALLSSPQAATPPRAHTISRDVVIHGSDEEDDESDSSLPDLSALPRQAGSPMAYPSPAAKGGNPCVTPQAKRTAIEFHSSPLTLMPKFKLPPKFDLKALMSHAQKDDATEASAQRVSATISRKQSPTGVQEQKDPAAVLHKHVMDLADGDDEEDGEVDKHKLRRAIDRTELGATRKRWYFFKQHFEPPAYSQNPFPNSAASGRWRFLRDAKSRREHFEHGIPHLLVRKRNDLPDEIFLWVLNQVCLEPADSLRAHYVSLLSACHEHVSRLVDPDRVHQIFNNLGSRWESTDISNRLDGIQEFNDPYPGRNWAQLRSVLQLLANAAPHIQPACLTCATNILLRLGIDTVVIENPDIMAAYQETFAEVVNHVSPSHWQEFCEEVCTVLHQSVKQTTLRWQSLSCIPSGDPRVHQLRRRLAAVSFFDDLKYAQPDVITVLAIGSITDRLKADIFAIGAQTDYHDLTAMIRLLDITVDDGLGNAFESSDARMQFDSDLDGLTLRLKGIWQGISTSGAGYISRLEAKTTLKSVQERLSHTVRSRPKPKTDIYSAIMGSTDDPFQAQKQERQKERQQAMMNSFLRKARPVGTSA